MIPNVEKVMNRASNQFVDVLGQADRHTRMAVGGNSLPYNVTVASNAWSSVRLMWMERKCCGEEGGL